VDCGGPCEKLCPGIQAPKPLFVCKKDFNPLSNQSIIFFIIIVLIIIVDILYSRKKIRDITKNRNTNDVKRAKAMLSVRRRMYLFVFIVLLVSLIIYLYYYFFIMCEVEYKFIWVLLLLLFLSPLIIHQVIRYLEYTENKRLKQLEALLETHYKELGSLVKMENEHLGEIEEEIAKELYRLLERPEFKKMTNADELAILNQLYKELVYIYSNYKENQNPVETEKLLCDEIYALVEGEKYKSLLSKEPILDGIANKLKLLYQAYEEKQKIYDEMSRVEASKREIEAELSSETSRVQYNGKKENIVDKS
jgi:hypothetical protein